MRYLFVVGLCLVSMMILGLAVSAEDPPQATEPRYTVRPIGWVRKSEGTVRIEVEKKYQDGLLGVEKLSEIWVLYWFDRNDTPKKRAVLQVHPRGNLENPLTGVFATRSPMRPNLIALTRCKIRSMKDNVIEVDEIDALPDTPVLDLKP